MDAVPHSGHGLGEAELDEIVQLEFPYPVAVIYKELLETDDLEHRADLCVKTFQFGIRAISLALIIGYLKSPQPDINLPELNHRLREYLPTSRPHQWIELMQDVLKAYRGHRERLFIPHLYDLYWDVPLDRAPGDGTAWKLLWSMAGLCNDIEAGRINRAAKAAELMRMLREVMRHFLFMRGYELWQVVSKQNDVLSIDVHNGVTIRRIHAYSRFIAEPDFSRIKTTCYYLTDRHGRLLEMDPLLIDSSSIRRPLDSHQDIGVFDGYYAQDLGADQGAMLQYLLLAADIRAETNDHDLIVKFLDLYEHQLGRKEQALTARLSLTWDHLYLAMRTQSELQIATALTKYRDDLYVEREGLNQCLRDFLQSPQTAMVITGDAGVGKTNLLVRLYERILVPRSDTATLWLDGAALSTQRDLTQTLFDVLDAHVYFGQEVAATPEQAERNLRRLMDGPLHARTLVVIIDGLNESTAPVEAAQRVNDFVNFVAPLPIKVIISSRTQVWRYVKRHSLKPYRHVNYYSRVRVGAGAQQGASVEYDSIVLARFDKDEQKRAFELYARADGVFIASLGVLNARLADALRDPLLLRIACDAFRGQAIPPELAVEAIIPKLIEQMIDDPGQTLTISDVEDFLEGQLVPQFFPADALPVNRLTRNMLRRVKVGQGKTLDDLVADKTPYSDGTPVNQAFQNLMNTGWLVRVGSPLNYEVRFRYEYFYEYFAGRYLTRLADQATDKLTFYRSSMAAMEQAPFLWGVVRNMLAATLDPGQVKTIRELISNANGLRKDVLVSVLVYAHRRLPNEVNATLHELLGDARMRRRSPLAPLIALEAAYELRHIDLLSKGLCHSDAELRAVTVQLVYQLWTKHYVDVCQHILRASIERIKMRDARGAAHAFEGAAGLTMLMAFADYERNGLRDSQMLEIQRIWQPVVRRFGFIIGGRSTRRRDTHPLRRVVTRIAAAALLQDMVTVDDAQQLVFGVADVRKFFPADARRKEMIYQLLPYFESAHGWPAPADKLVALSRGVLENPDMLTALFTFAALTASYIGHALEMMPHVLCLFDYAKELARPPQRKGGKPIARILTPQLTMLGQSAPYFQLMAEGTAGPVLEACAKLVVEYELFFGGMNEGKRRLYYWSDLAEYSYWHYQVYGTAVSPTMTTVLDTVCGEGNVEKIRFLLRRFAHIARCSMWRAPAVSLAGVGEIIVRLDRRELTKLEHDLADCIANIRMVDSDQVDGFLSGLNDDTLNRNLKERIRSIRPSINMGYVMGDAAIVFAKAFLSDDDSTVRDFVKMFALRATESRSLSAWISWLVLELAGYIRESPMMAPESGSGPRYGS